jgi:hypothetical protein
LAASSSVSSFIASRIFSLRDFFFPPPMFWNMLWSWPVSSSMPGGARISALMPGTATSISTSLSSSSPSRSFLRNFWRVALSSGAAGSVPNPPSAGRRQQDVEHPVFGGVLGPVADLLHGLLAVRLDGDFHQIADDGVHIAAHIAHFGELGRLDLDEGRVGQAARRRAISVLPTPVGPIIRMFLGVISLFSGSATWARRQRLRRATATAFLALPWPTMCLSSSETISGGHLGHGTSWVQRVFPPVTQCRPRKAAGSRLQHLDGVAMVGVDAQVTGDGQGFLDHFGRQLGVLDQPRAAAWA